MPDARPRERVEAALTGEACAPTPTVIPYLSIFLRDHWDEVTDKPWWVSQYGTFEERCQVLERMTRAIGSDWVQVGECTSRTWRHEHEVVTQGEQTSLLNRRTGETTAITRTPVSGSQYQSSLVEPRVCTLDDVEANVPVAAAEDRDQAGWLDFIRHAKEELGARLCLLAPVSGPLWRTHGLFGFNAMMTNLVEAPGLVQALVERITLDQIERAKAYARAGVDCVWIEDCMTSGDLISREHFQKFHAPYVAKIVDAIRAGGMKSVYYFCGDPWDRLDDILDTGADAVSFEESKKGFEIDLDDVEKAVDGRAAILGNLDAIALLPHASPEQLRDEVKRQLDIGRRTGKFVASLGSPVTPGTPTSRVKLFTDLVRELSA